MTDNADVEVAYGDDASITAQNLLAAAARLDEPAFVVRNTSRGVFIVPQNVADEAEAFAEGSGVDVVVNDGPEDLSNVGKARLDQIAEDEEIDLTGAKGSNAAKAQRISEVRTERLQAALEAEAAKAQVADSSDSESEEVTDDENQTVPGDENKE